MGFFKKIGEGIKKATKQISFKNLVKVVKTGVSFVPGVGEIAGGVIGNLQQAHEDKKAAAAAQNDYDRQVAEYNASQAAQAAAAGAGQITGTVAGQFTNSLIKNTYAGASQGFQNGVNEVGSQVASGVLKQWFADNWKKLAVGLGAVVTAFAIFKLATRRGTTQRRRY